MTFLAILFWALYLGTPFFVIGWWIRLPHPASGKPMWPMFTALGLWLLQFGVWVVMVAGCLGGHCRLSALQEYGPYAVTIVAYVAIVWMLWTAWTISSRERSGRTPHPPG